MCKTAVPKEDPAVFADDILPEAAGGTLEGSIPAAAVRVYTPAVVFLGNLPLIPTTVPRGLAGYPLVSLLTMAAMVHHQANHQGAADSRLPGKAEYRIRT